MLDVTRQVLPITERILLEQGRLWAIALRNRKDKPVTSTKVEWKEMSYSPVKVKLTTATAVWYFTAGANKDIDTDTTNLLVWDILSVQDKDKKSKGDLRLMVTEIISSTQAKAQKIWGTDVAIETTDFLYVETATNEEGSKVGKRRQIQLPRTRYNYTQIIRAGHIIPRTQAEVNNYDFKDVKNELRTQAYKRWGEQFDGLVTSTIRTSVMTAQGERRVAWGLFYFANNNFDAKWDLISGATDNIKAVNWALTIDLVNEAFRYAIENWGNLNSVVVNTKQAIAISKLFQDKVNVNIINGTTPKTIGGAVQILKSPINVAGNEISQIYLDLKMPQDEITFFNDKIIEANYLQNSWVLEKIKQPTSEDDNFSIDLLWEWTIIVRNARENTYTLKKLDA